MIGASLEHGVAMANGVRIAYQVSGEGPPLVCCHPMGWDHTVWDRHRERFSRHHRLVTFDQRGAGDSDHPLFVEGPACAYTVESFGQDLRAVLDALDLKRAHILGYSMGAVAALRLATQSPERVERLVLVSAMASRLPEEIIRRARTVEERLARDGLRSTYDYYFSGPLFEGESSKAGFEESLRPVVAKATEHGFKGCFRVTIDRPSMVDELKRIQAPTLVVVGERDRHYVAEAELLVSEITDAKKLVVPDAGHALTTQSPELFEGEVLRFLAEPTRA